VNAEPTGFDDVADVVFREQIGDVLPGDRQLRDDSVRRGKSPRAMESAKTESVMTGHRSQILLSHSRPYVIGLFSICAPRFVRHSRCRVRASTICR
jgi:hypothetical protein